LFEVLRAIKLKIPGDLVGGKETELDLFSLVYNNRDILIIGVTDSMNASKTENFFFWRVIPKLQAHGLAQNQKVPGAHYRRASLNNKGQKFFADFEKRYFFLQKEMMEQS
jgi:hypothetical protein